MCMTRLNILRISPGCQFLKCFLFPVEADLAAKYSVSINTLTYLECGDLSPLFRNGGHVLTKAQSGDKSPHSKFVAVIMNSRTKSRSVAALALGRRDLFATSSEWRRSQIPLPRGRNLPVSFLVRDTRRWRRKLCSRFR